MPRRSDSEVGNNTAASVGDPVVAPDAADANAEAPVADEPAQEVAPSPDELTDEELEQRRAAQAGELPETSVSAPPETAAPVNDPRPDVQVKLNPDYVVPTRGEDGELDYEHPETATVSVPGFDSVEVSETPISVPADQAEALVFSPAVVKDEE